MKPSTSFILTRFPVPHSVYRDIHTQIDKLTISQRHFVLHVLVSNLINLQKIRNRGLDGYLGMGIELPIQWIEEHFTSHFRVSQIDPSLLTMTTYSTLKHECRAFTAGALLLKSILEWSPPPSGAAEPVVNLFDGRPYEVQAPAQREHGIFSSKIIRDAVKVFDSCPFNEVEVRAHLAEMEASVILGVSPAEQEHRRLALQNDRVCAMRILGGNERGKDGLTCYRPEFRTSYTGRITEVGGGSQSCSRAMKRALFGGIPKLKNYDLRRAQAFILLQELEDAGLPRGWVERYANEENANEKRAYALGISKDAYKACLYATIMGASHARLWDSSKNEVFQRLLKERSGDYAKAKAVTISVYGALAPLKREVDAWHDYLMKDQGCRHVDSTRRRVRTLKNACGQHFKLEGERSDKLARRAAAFILQGQEAAFIHRLTVLGSIGDFKPISNQHDGLVVLGQIDTTAVRQAARESGLRYATLEEKEFV
jgi:hypothetical protein